MEIVLIVVISNDGKQNRFFSSSKFLFFLRKILENFQFSPIRHLEKNGQTGLLRLATSASRTERDLSETLTEFQETIIAYFRSRNEDNTKRAVPTINLKMEPAIPVKPAAVTMTKPVFVDDNALRPSPSVINPYASTFDTNDPDQNLAVIENDSFFEPSIHDVGTMRRYPPTHAYPRQNVYYDDGLGNDRLPFPEEISF